MREEIIRRTEAFMRAELMKLADYKDNNRRMAEYRIEHSIRVAHIAADIARKEGFDEERAFVAGLLHDIGYSIDYETKEDYRNHGRYGARIARPFLRELGYSKAQVEEMCYGIAIHVDEKADFAGENTPLALTIGDADNIDRFDAFRAYEALQDAEYRDLPLEEQRSFVAERTERLKQYRGFALGTETATAMWRDKLDFQLNFLERLKNQIEHAVIAEIPDGEGK
jgi:uncharacterized domain HDIG